MKSFLSGFIKENPVFVLYLGLCSTLAISTNLVNGLGMGISVIVVLMMSNAIISALRNYIPDEIRIPVYIVIIATLVTIVQLLLQAFVVSLYDALGVFIALIVVNCIILGRAEAFASKNPVIPSIIDGLSMGLGYTFALVLISVIRQVLATGALSMYNPFDPSVMIFELQIIPHGYEISLFGSGPGAFITLAVLAALFGYAKDRSSKKEAK